METDQVTLLSILGCAIGLFLWGRWRHDMVAVGALLACAMAGLVPVDWKSSASSALRPLMAWSRPPRRPSGAEIIHDPDG